MLRVTGRKKKLRKKKTNLPIKQLFGKIWYYKTIQYITNCYNLFSTHKKEKLREFAY